MDLLKFNRATFFKSLPPARLPRHMLSIPLELRHRIYFFLWQISRQQPYHVPFSSVSVPDLILSPSGTTSKNISSFPILFTNHQLYAELLTFLPSIWILGLQPWRPGFSIQGPDSIFPQLFSFRKQFGGCGKRLVLDLTEMGEAWWCHTNRDFNERIVQVLEENRVFDKVGIRLQQVDDASPRNIQEGLRAFFQMKGVKSVDVTHVATREYQWKYEGVWRASVEKFVGSDGVEVSDNQPVNHDLLTW